MDSSLLSPSQGIKIGIKEPLISWENGQGRIHDVRVLTNRSRYQPIHDDLAPPLQQLRNLGMQCRQKHGGMPNLILVILPEGANDIYTAVKQCVILSLLMVSSDVCSTCSSALVTLRYVLLSPAVERD
jgi:hypothetical protein